MKKISFIFLSLLGCFFLSNGKTILFIGDSITDGNWGSPSTYPCSSDQRNKTDMNHILGHGFVEMTAGYYMGEFPEGDYKFINRGISGETLDQIASRWEKDALFYHPDVISLLCGTNDIHYWLETNPKSINDFNYTNYGNNLDSLLNITIKTLPDCKIILGTPFTAKSGWVGDSSNYYLREQTVDSIATLTREIVDKYSNKNVFLIDFNKLKNNLLSENKNMEYWLWDGIHPTTAMHYRMSKEWIKLFGTIPF